MVDHARQLEEIVARHIGYDSKHIDALLARLEKLGVETEQYHVKSPFDSSAAKQHDRTAKSPRPTPVSRLRR